MLLHSFSAGLLTQSVSTGGGQKQKTVVSRVMRKFNLQTPAE